MRRLVVALIALTLALGLAGCGGGAEEPETTAPPVAAPAAAVDPNAPPIEDKSPQEGEVFELLPDAEKLPEAVNDRLKDKQPMVIMFIDAAQLETDDVRDEVKAAVNSNAGLADLLVYDLGKYRSKDSTSVTEVQTKIQTDETAKRAQSFAREIGAVVTPFVIVVDSQGYIIFKWRGVIDRDLIGRQVERVG